MWRWVLGVDTQQVGGGIVVLAGVMGAAMTTLRYMKRTEDDVVDNLREEVVRLQTQLGETRQELAEAKLEAAKERIRTHRQIDMLVKLVRQSGVEIPEEFWAI